jgi:hypothetical protein
MRVTATGAAAAPYRASAVAGDPLDRERDRARMLLSRARAGT